MNGEVRAWFRQLRTRDHLRDADQLFRLQQWTTGQLAICRVGRVTLYDTDIPPEIDLEAWVEEIHRTCEERDRLRERRPLALLAAMV